ncbi:MAG: FAD-dependent oxidoreductase [Rhizobiaceae bacterium]
MCADQTHPSSGREGNGDPVIVAGAGLAGLAAGLRLAELGVPVRVLEAREEELYPCNTRQSGGVLHVAFRSVFDDPSTLSRAVRERTALHVEQGIADTLASNARRAVEWLHGHGVTTASMQPDEGWKDCIVEPLGFHDGIGLVWRDLGSDRMMQRLEERLLAAGVAIERGMRAMEILRPDGSCDGLVVRHQGAMLELPARAIVIADGGFQGDAAMLRRFFAPHPDLLIQRGPGTSTGDGIRMAEAIGADTVGMDAFYGHLLSADALSNDKLWPFPFLDFVAGAGMLVDAEANRFVDEGRGGVFMANMVARRKDPRPIFAIFDEAIWNEAGCEFFAPPNPNLLRAGGTLHRADSLGELARIADLPGDRLAAQVAEHNARIAGRLDSLSPARTDPGAKTRPIASPPFYAAPGRAAITHTMGGLRINATARVRDRTGQPIQGLYAAGNSAGGFEGGPTIGYIGGLMRALVFGLVAAEDIAERHSQAG